MQPLKTIVSAAVAHRLRAELGEVDDRQPPVHHPDAAVDPHARPVGPARRQRGAHALERVTVRRAVAPDLDAEAAHLGREIEALAGRGGHERLEQPRVRLRCPASPRATARPARSARRRPRCPRPSRPAPTPPRAGRRRAGRRPGGGTSSRPSARAPSTANSREPRSTRTSCVSAQPGSVWRCSIEWSVTAGRCWCSVPPRATLSACAPRQMPRIGRPMRSATRATSSSKTSSAGSTGPRSSRRRVRRTRSGRGPGRPTGRSPRSGASSDGTASTGSGGRTTGTAPARASARTYGMPSAISCWGGSPSGSGCVRSARRTSEVVTPTRGLLSIRRQATQGASGPVDRIHTSGIGIFPSC